MTMSIQMMCGFQDFPIALRSIPIYLIATVSLLVPSSFLHIEGKELHMGRLACSKDVATKHKTGAPDALL
jgi:hypothetical protein